MVKATFGNTQKGLLKNMIDLINDIGPQKPYHSNYITNELDKIGRGAKGETPERTINSYMSQNRTVFQFIGNGYYKLNNAFVKNNLKEDHDKQKSNEVTNDTEIEKALVDVGFRENNKLQANEIEDTQLLSDVMIGAGFGEYENNKKVEAAAIDFTISFYSSCGYEVQSVESQNLGYDLICKSSEDILFVEVKGVSNNGVGFIMTNNEYSCAEKLENFILCVVTSALQNPALHIFNREDIFDKLDFKPISFQAKLKAQ